MSKKDIIPKAKDRTDSSVADDTVTVDAGDKTPVLDEDNIPFYVDEVAWVDLDHSEQVDEFERLFELDFNAGDIEAEPEMIDVSDVIVVSADNTSELEASLKSMEEGSSAKRSSDVLKALPRRRIMTPRTGEHWKPPETSNDRPTRPAARQTEVSSADGLKRTQAMLALMREITTTEGFQYLKLRRSADEAVAMQLFARDGLWMFGVGVGEAIYVEPNATGRSELYRKLKPYTSRSIYKGALSPSRVAGMLRVLSPVSRDALLHTTALAVLIGLERLGAHDGRWDIKRRSLEFIPPQGSPFFTGDELFRELMDLTRHHQPRDPYIDALAASIRERADDVLIFGQLQHRGLWLPYHVTPEV
ncbi:MAG: hypothetical protein AAFS10_13580, partial [Myxococcota bacterium]